jgi:hypothetical protein
MFAVSTVLLIATTCNVNPIMISNAFAQNSTDNTIIGNTTSFGNITGGGINVPLNESLSSPSTPNNNQSVVPTNNTDQNTVETSPNTTASANLSETNSSFSINTDMMRPVLYLIDPASDKIITVDLSQDPKYPNGSMPLHTLINPEGNKALLSTMSSDTAPATILALKIGKIDWESGKADVSISNVTRIAEPGTKPIITNIQNHTTNQTQPIIAKMWIPNNIQIHGPSLHPSGNFAYFTQWTNNMIRVIDLNNGSLATSDPIQIDNVTQWLHGVFFNPSGDKALSPHYFFEGNHLHLFDVNNETGELTNPVEITLGNDAAYAAFPHFVTWINNTHAITSTQQIGPTSFTPNNTKIIGPSVWLINTENAILNNDNSSEPQSSATMIIAPTNSTSGNGILSRHMTLPL